MRRTDLGHNDIIIESGAAQLGGAPAAEGRCARMRVCTSPKSEALPNFPEPLRSSGLCCAARVLSQPPDLFVRKPLPGIDESPTVGLCCDETTAVSVPVLAARAPIRPRDASVSAAAVAAAALASRASSFRRRPSMLLHGGVPGRRGADAAAGAHGGGKVSPLNALLSSLCP